MKSRGDADIAAGPLRLPFGKARQRLPRIADIVQLQEIHLLRLQSRQRSAQLGRIGRFELGGDEKFLAAAGSAEHRAEDALGIAVGRGGVDQAPAIRGQDLNDRLGFAAGRCSVVIEHIGGAETDRRQLLAAFRNRAGDERRGALRKGLRR